MSADKDRKIKVLIVDDSEVFCRFLVAGLALDPKIEVVGTANDPYSARDMILRHQPDVLTLDVEMPRMDGITFLKRLMPQHPLPAVMVSSLTVSGAKTTLDALEAGAVDFVAKPRSGSDRDAMLVELRTKLKIASTARLGRDAEPSAGPMDGDGVPFAANGSRSVLAIGASTGGTEAIKSIVARLPEDCPGVVVVQHMPALYTKSFAERLDTVGRVRVSEAKWGDPVVPGHVLIAPGDLHMKLRRKNDQYFVECLPGEKRSGHRPSVDVLFHSVALEARADAVGVLLTGMGADGAEGLLAMRKSGARTLAQDESSCVIFGMPKAAIAIGAAEQVLALGKIPERALELLRRK